MGDSKLQQHINVCRLKLQLPKDRIVHSSQKGYFRFESVAGRHLPYCTLLTKRHSNRRLEWNGEHVQPLFSFHYFIFKLLLGFMSTPEAIPHLKPTVNTHFWRLPARHDLCQTKLCRAKLTAESILPYWCVRTPLNTTERTEAVPATHDDCNKKSATSLKAMSLPFLI